MEGGAARLCLSNELLEDQFLCQPVSVHLIKPIQHVSAKHLERYRLSVGIELFSEKLLELLLHSTPVRLILAVMQHSDLLVKLHQLLLFQEAILIQILKIEKLLHQWFHLLKRLLLPSGCSAH